GGQNGGRGRQLAKASGHVVKPVELMKLPRWLSVLSKKNPEMVFDYVIVGLGNPGAQYAMTRHNIGFMAVDALQEGGGEAWKLNKKLQSEVSRINICGKSCLLAKPQTFMNESGRALSAISRFYGVPVDRFVVAYDEFQIPLGEYKVSLQGGDSGHNGIKSILAHLGNGFVRYRLGIGALERRSQGPLKLFVLDNFSVQERSLLEEFMSEIVDGLRQVVDRGPILA